MRIFTLFLLFFSSDLFSMTVNEFVADAGVSFAAIGNLNVIKKFNFVTNSGGHFIFTLEDKNKNMIDFDISVNVSRESAKTSIANFSNLLKISYGDKPSPYAGEITNVEKCPTEYQPKSIKEKIANHDISFFESSAGARFQYGACDKASAVYSVCTLFHYDEAHRIFSKIKYFYPFGKADCSIGINSILSGIVYK